MKKIISFLSFVFSLVVLFSCEPGRDENGDLLFGVIQNPETSANSKLLKKMTATDNEGNLSTFIYNYENGLLKSVSINENEDQRDLDLTYDKDKISTMVITETDGSNIITTTADLIYDNNKLIGTVGKMESGVEEISTNKTTFTYNGTLLQKIETSIQQKDPENPDTYVDAFKQVSDILFQGNNIASWKMTMTTISPLPVGVPPIVFDVKFSNYDTSKNPLATLPREFNIAAAHLLSGTNSIQGLSVNNYRNASSTAGGTSQDVTYVYEYDKDGYPKSATSTQGTLTYEYQ